jgi:hypothetical protein
MICLHSKAQGSFDPPKYYNSILALEAKKGCKENIGVFDIKTVKYMGKLYPYAVGFAYFKHGYPQVENNILNLGLKQP